MNRNLDAEQLELFSQMVAADRRVPREQRDSFYFIETMGGGFLIHPGLGERPNVPRSDILSLGEAGLLRLARTGSGGLRIDITPAGYRFHAELQGNIAEPARDIEGQMKRHLDGVAFQQRYPAAYAKWASANRLLYAEDAHQHLTRIGHDCTEAMQAFANALVQIYNPPGVDPNPGSYIKRIDTVINLRKPRVGAKRSALLHALVGYWVAASALAERQEHGADKTGDPVSWDDARRVVFHTAIAMFEIDSTLQAPGAA